MEIIDHTEDTYLIRLINKLDIVLLYHILISKIGVITIKIGWQEKRIGRNVKTRMQRIYVNTKLEPLKIYFFRDLTGIRVTGQVVECEYRELIGKKIGGDIKIGDLIKLETKEDLIRLSKEDINEGIGVIILDITGYLIAEVTDKIEILAEKYMPYQEFYDKDFQKDIRILNESINRLKEKGYIIVAGVNIGAESVYKHLKNVDIHINGDFNPDISGVLTLLKNEKIRNIRNKYIKLLELYHELIYRDRFNKIVYGVENVFEYAEQKLLNKILVIEDLILEKPNLIGEIYDTYKKCISIEIIEKDSSIGLYLNKLGGIVGFLKF